MVMDEIVPKISTGFIRTETQPIGSLQKGICDRFYQGQDKELFIFRVTDEKRR